MSASRVLLMALALLMAAVAVSEAAQARKPLPASRDHPGKCYDPSLRLVLAPGASQNVRGKCQQYSCAKTKTGFELLTSTCGIVHAGPGCVVDKSNNLPYPQCCTKLKCS